MKRYFLFILCALVVINLCIKSFIYFTSDKVEAKVIGLENYRTTYRTRKGGTSYEDSISPELVYKYKGNIYQISKNEWGRINLLNINDKVTMLIANEGITVRLNTLFQFWFTLYDMLIAFSICLVGTMILGTVLPEKKEKIKEWK